MYSLGYRYEKRVAFGFFMRLAHNLPSRRPSTGEGEDGMESRWRDYGPEWNCGTSLELRQPYSCSSQLVDGGDRARITPPARVVTPKKLWRDHKFRHKWQARAAQVET